VGAVACESVMCNVAEIAIFYTVDLELAAPLRMNLKTSWTLGHLRCRVRCVRAKVREGWESGV